MLGLTPDGIFGISIHALREEGDPSFTRSLRWRNDFYPRPPRGGRLKSGAWVTSSSQFLSTPSARRATRHTPRCFVHKVISIHALREEGDEENPKSLWSIKISIHALREEGDPDCTGQSGLEIQHFYPRPPRGGRLPLSNYLCCIKKFLSTPSARRATSISRPTTTSALNFYPRPPRGGRPGMHLVVLFIK